MAVASLASQLFAEFIGTYLLVFTIGCNVLLGNAVWGAVSIASVLMVSIYALGGISGAHFNPAVTVALGIVKALGGERGVSPKTIGLYCTVQIIAGILAALSYSALFGTTFNLAPSPGFTGYHASMCEQIYTFMLCFVVLNVAIASENSPNDFYGLAIGSVILAGAYGAGAVSGGCFNPAVAIGIDVASSGLGFGWCMYYTLAELVGAAVAAAAFKIVRPEDFGGERDTKAVMVSEFIGTHMLCLTVGLNVMGKSPAAAYSIGACLMSMIYALGDVSGAHFNPAVTVALVRCGRMPEEIHSMSQKIVAQLLGALFASFHYTMIYDGGSFRLGPGYIKNVGAICSAEFMFTFVLCYVVLAVVVSTKTSNASMYGLAIGSCIVVGGNAIGVISGGALNPAVAFAIASGHGFHDNSGVMCLLYSVFEIFGGLAAATVFKTTHAVDNEEQHVKIAEA